MLNRITTGEFKAGDKLPTEEELCREYDVSRITVRRAVSELTARMLISPRRGVGTVVANRGSDRRVYRLSGLFGHPSTFKLKKIVSATEKASAEIAKALCISEGSPVRHYRYISLHKNLPFTLLDAYDAEASPGTKRGAKALAIPATRRIGRAEQELIAVTSDALCEKYLGYAAGQPMMEARRVVYASDGSPIRYSISRYHPDRYRFLVDLLPTKGTDIFEAS